MKKRPNVIIRMGAAHWDAQVLQGNEYVHFDFSHMTKRERADFHRELMNAFRAVKRREAA